MGTYDGYREGFYGSVSDNPFAISGAQIDVKTIDSAVPGRGQAFGGNAGEFHILFDDGRELRGTFKIGNWEGLRAQGQGSGADQNGNRATFAFGMRDEELQASVDRFRELSSTRPALPPVLAKGQVRPPAPSPGGKTPAQPGNQTSTGTGFVIESSGTIVTCYHVIENATQVVCVFADGKRHAARVIHTSRANDVAILKIETQAPVASLALGTDFAQGDPVFVMGFPMSGLLGREPKYTEGVVSSLSGLGGDGMSMQITVPIQPGSSGSPLIHPKSGTVIGVVTSSAALAPFLSNTGTIPQNVNWAVKSNAIRALVQVPDSGNGPQSGSVDFVRKAICRIEAR